MRVRSLGLSLGGRHTAKFWAAILGLAAAIPSFGAPSTPLRFFKNYFVTGDYAVAGVSLRGRPSEGGFTEGTIDMAAVPDGADIVAAFLYWQTVEATASPSASRGRFRGREIYGKPLGSPGNTACQSFTEGDPARTGAAARVYRADVLRHLPIDKTRNIRIANGSHGVRLPSSGNLVIENGASLVVVYRIVVPGNPNAAPLRSVVLYDGAHTISTASNESRIMWLPVAGFYQAAQSAAAKVTPIAGTSHGSSRVTFESEHSRIALRAFDGSQGIRWFNPVIPLPLAQDAPSFLLSGEAVGDDGYPGCATFGAVVASTAVSDGDRDGLLDTWETGGLYYNPGSDSVPAAFGSCAAFRPQPCLDLPAMGAVNGQRDIFLEMDWMEGANDSGTGTHLHRPKREALLQVAAAFRRQNVRLHFDVGGNYQDLAVGPDFVIVPQTHAQGGEVIQESSLLCPNAVTPMASCTYTAPYSVLSYKKGLVSVRDGNAKLGLPSRFSPSRKDAFHYALWGHAMAGPFDPATGRPLSSNPKSISGVADRPGGDMLITLGLWRSNLPENDQTGSVLVQAGTLMHELGHNLGLSHAGAFRVPNCMPNYQSVMNYLYQTRGLTPAAGGDKVIDFSPGILPSLTELALNEGPASTPYRVRHYGPVTASDPPGSAAQLQCDGSPITNGARMIRLENEFPNFIDWDHDGRLTSGPLRIDINFSGTAGDGVNGGSTFIDANDWSLLNLQQVGARLNVGRLSVGVGVSDLGVSDLGALELGALELGALELGVSDLGVSDLGALELGALELGDVDYDTAVLSTIDPPPAPSPSCPSCGLQSSSLIDRVRLNWTAPETGSVLSYNIYRNSPGNPGVFTFVKSVPGGQVATAADDIVNGSTTLYNTAYTYYVTSLVQVNGSIVESAPSNKASGIVKRLFVTGLEVARLYLDPNPALFTVTGLDLPAPAGAGCTTTATPASNAGKYPIVCSGPAVTANPVNGITYANGTLTINPRPQTINFAALADKTTADPPFTVAATATSGLAVVFAASGNCTVSGNTVTVTGVGSCTITANQPGSINYLPAPAVQRTFTITLAGFRFANFFSTSGLTLNGSAHVSPAGALRLTSGIEQRSATWFSQPQVVTSGFTTTFRFQTTQLTYAPADGFAFVVQTGGVNAMGTWGSGIGYNGLPGSLAVEFDTWHNPFEFNDANANHVAVQSNGTAANTARHGSPATLAINNALPFRIADRVVHEAVITYVPGTLTVRVDGVLIVTAPVNLATLLALPANGTARVGITSATGSAAEITDILNWSFTPTR